MLSAVRMYSGKEKREVWFLLGMQRVSGMQVYKKLPVMQRCVDVRGWQELTAAPFSSLSWVPLTCSAPAVDGYAVPEAAAGFCPSGPSAGSFCHILSDNNPNTNKESAKEFFAEMAEKYADYNNVLYEICNEPNGGTSWSDIKSYAEAVFIDITRKPCQPMGANPF